MDINLYACDSCPSGYTVEDVEYLQTQLDKKIASVVNKEFSSNRNDLGYCMNTEAYTKLVWLQNILEQVKYCNDCFGDYDFEDILSVIKNIKNKL